MPEKIDFTFKIAGEAGYGIMVSGLIFSKLALRSGFFVFDINEYPSLIRGGHNVYTVRVSEKKIYSQVFPVDFLVALNKNAIDFHQQELSKRATLILNTDRIDLKTIKISPKIKLFPLPLTKLVQQIGAPEVMMNTVALGATAFLLKADFEILVQILRDVFGAREKDVDLNVRAAKIGFDFAKNNFGNQPLLFNLKRRKNNQKILLSGNDAICLGAIKAGCKFFAGYPMTPINSMISYFARKGRDLGIVYFQPEDEISGINSAIGAGFVGLRSMVATSGGGFSLMVEAYGLAGMTETPLVIVLGQRPGPSTGLPTWGGQGDLRFVLHAGQDDFPRIVLAPGDQEECFWLTIEAFNLADRYQTPVVILVDKHLCESHQSLDLPDQNKVRIDRGLIFSPANQKGEYRRYQITNSGISPRQLVTREGIVFRANSDEHDQFGFSEEDPINRKKMVEKRMKKLATLEKKLPNPKVYGQAKAKITLIGWGSTKGPVLEAQKILEKERIKTNFLHLNYLNPFPANFVLKFLRSAKKTLLIEQNPTAQAGGLIREKTGIEIKNQFLKYDGRPYFPEEIVKKVKEIV